MFERVELGRLLVAERGQPRPPTWPALAKKYGRTSSTLRALYDAYLAQNNRHMDRTGEQTVTRALHLYDEAIEGLARLAHDPATPASAKVAAIRVMMENVVRQINLLAALDRMPRSFRAHEELVRIREIISRFVGIAEQFQFPPEALAALEELMADMQKDTVIEAPVRPQLSAAG